MNATETVIDIAATYRLCRLAQVDTFPPAQKIRDLVDRSASDWLHELYNCPYCLSMWIGLSVAIARRRFPRLWAPFALALAASAATGPVLHHEKKAAGV